MTMPPGAGCLLANIFALMVGLSVAWQKRRTTRGERQDYRFFYDILTLNLGRGYFTTDRFKAGPTVYSDASRSKRYTGGGWCSSSGTYDWMKHERPHPRRGICRAGVSAPFNSADMAALQTQSRQRVDMAELSRMLPALVLTQAMIRGWLLRRGTTSKMALFQDWAEEICGVQFKAASQVQLFLGLWWDSFSGTRTLEERKLVQYMDMLLEFSMRKTLTLVAPRFYRGEGPALSCHVQGDFGTRGMPGAFKIFFVDVVLNMARAAETLTIP
jgi:hypothetical protein